jgi:hypothetical protein
MSNHQGAQPARKLEAHAEHIGMLLVTGVDTARAKAYGFLESGPDIRGKRRGVGLVALRQG